MRSFSMSVFSLIRVEYGDLRIQSEYGKIRTRKNSIFGHFLRSERNSTIGRKGNYSEQKHQLLSYISVKGLWSDRNQKQYFILYCKNRSEHGLNKIILSITCQNFQSKLRNNHCVKYSDYALSLTHIFLCKNRSLDTRKYVSEKTRILTCFMQ